MNPREKIKRLLGRKGELCACKIMELVIRKIVKDAIMQYEDAPSRIAPASSED